MFDGILLPMCFMLEAKIVAMERSLQPWCAIDEKHARFDVMLLLELLQELFC